jgi:uncharacterized protein YqkB
MESASLLPQPVDLEKLPILISTYVSVFVQDPIQLAYLLTILTVFQVILNNNLVCPPTFYSNTYNGVRECIQLCPPGTIDSLTAPNLYGDNGTQSCVSSCVTPLRWADPHTRICEAVCSSTPPLYS